MKKIKAIFKNTNKLCQDMSKYIKEYSNIDYYGFPKIKKLVIISKFPRITNNYEK